MFLNQELETISTTNTASAFEQFQQMDGVDTIIIDGVITDRMMKLASEKSVSLITGAVLGQLSNKYDKPQFATFNRIR